MPPAWWAELDDLLEVACSSDFSWGDDGEGSTEAGEGGDVLSDAYVYPTIKIEARDLREGDYIEGSGVVMILDHLKQYISVLFKARDDDPDAPSSALYEPAQALYVRIEDDLVD